MATDKKFWEGKIAVIIENIAQNESFRTKIEVETQLVFIVYDKEDKKGILLEFINENIYASHVLIGGVVSDQEKLFEFIFNIIVYLETQLKYLNE